MSCVTQNMCYNTLIGNTIVVALKFQGKY